MDAGATPPPPTPPAHPRQQVRRRSAASAASSAGHSLFNSFWSPLLSELRLLLAPRDLYGPVKAAILADGYVVAAGLVMAAVLVNHIRRVLAPWLGQFLWWHPVEAMKLARGTPHYFLEEQLHAAADGEALCLWLLQTAVLAATKALLRHRLLSGAVTRVVRHQQSRDVASRGAAAGGTGARAALTADAALPASWLTDCYRILYLTLCLMHIEYAYAEACWVASWLHAVTHVYLRGTSAEREHSHQVLTGRHRPPRSDASGIAALGHWPPGLLLIAGLLLAWAGRAVQPFRRHGTVGVALSALAVLGVFIGVVTAYVIRYSNKYFIWLEMSEMLLTWLWMLLGLLLIAAWRLNRSAEGIKLNLK